MTKKIIDVVKDSLKRGVKSTQEIADYINRTTKHGITSSQLGSILKRKEFLKLSKGKNPEWKLEGENNEKKCENNEK